MHLREQLAGRGGEQLTEADLVYMRRLLEAGLPRAAAKIYHGRTDCGMSPALTVVNRLRVSTPLSLPTRKQKALVK